MLTETELDFTPVLRLMRLEWSRGKDHFPCHVGPERSLRGSEAAHPESFSAMIIAELMLGQREQREPALLLRGILDMLERELGSEHRFHFFKQHERLPPDADCTALGLSLLLRGGSSPARLREAAQRALDAMLRNCNAAGVVETYWDPSAERAGIVDAVVCCNVLFLAHLLDRAGELGPTLEHVRWALITQAYLRGTRYYHSPDTFLFFLGRLVRCFPADTEPFLLEPLATAIRERLGTSRDTIDMAQRALLCSWFGIEDDGEGQRLLDAREADGCWANDALFRYGRSRAYFGSRALTAAFAMAALLAMRRRRDGNGGARV